MNAASPGEFIDLSVDPLMEVVRQEKAVAASGVSDEP